MCLDSVLWALEAERTRFRSLHKDINSGLLGSCTFRRKLLASSFNYFALPMRLTRLLHRKFGVFIVYNSLNTQFSLLGSPMHPNLQFKYYYLPPILSF